MNMALDHGAPSIRNAGWYQQRQGIEKRRVLLEALLQQSLNAMSIQRLGLSSALILNVRREGLIGAFHYQKPPVPEGDSRAFYFITEAGRRWLQQHSKS